LTGAGAAAAFDSWGGIAKNLKMIVTALPKGGRLARQRNYNQTGLIDFRPFATETN